MFGEAVAASGTEIAGDADFYGNLARGEFLNQFWVLIGFEAVANAFSAKI